jgi:NADH dehydrogenase
VRVLVTGGTGFLGSHLVPRLVAAGHAVRVLARGERPLRLPEAVVVVKGDVASGAGLDGALHDVDAVIHLVAVIRDRGEYTFQRVNHLGPAKLAAAMRAGGVRRLVHLSALGASPEPRLRYTHSKWLGEQEVRQSGLDYTIFRPSILFGRGDDFLPRLRRSTAPFPFFAPLPGGGKTRFQPIWVEDVVTCLLLALERGDTIGQLYEIGGPEHLTYEQILDLVLHALGLRRIKVPIPLSLVRPAAALMERLLPDPLVTSHELSLMDVENITALDAVMRAFHFPPASLGEKIAYLRET